MFQMKTLGALGLSFLLMACGGSSHEGEVASTAKSTNTSTTEPTKSGNSYRVVIEQSYEPFIMRNEHGVPEGFDIDVLNAIAKNQGFQVNFETDLFTEIPNRLTRGTADIAASAITITEKRKEIMDFTEPYYTSSTVIIAGKDVDITDIKSLKNLQGKKMAVQRSSYQADMAANANLDTVYEESVWLAVKLVIAGKADVSLGDAGSMGYYVAKYSEENLKIIPLPEAPVDHIGFAVKKGNTELLGKLNAGLAAIKADGTYDQLQKKWFKQ